MNPKFQFPKIFFLCFSVLLVSSCIKNDGTIIGDAKVRIFNNVISDTTKNFYFNNILYAGATGQGALSSSTNSAYFVVVADRDYTIDARNSIKGTIDSAINQRFGLGLNYSIYYTQRDTLPGTKPHLIVYQDLVKPDLTKAQVMFINMGYTLGSDVFITNRLGTYKDTLGYGKKTDYISIIDVDSSKSSIFLNLIDSTGVVDTISYTNFAKGKVYTVIIDGTKKGKLKQRLVANN